jgi:hypothetical protein
LRSLEQLIIAACGLERSDRVPYKVPTIIHLNNLLGILLSWVYIFKIKHLPKILCVEGIIVNLSNLLIIRQTFTKNYYINAVQMALCK